VTLGDLPHATVRTLLRERGLRLRLGPFIARVASSLREVEQSVRTLYAFHEIAPGEHGAHFTLRVDPPGTVRRFVRPQVQLTFEGREPFLPLPRRMAAAMLEGGLNWCVGNFAHQFVVIHAATLERHGRALLMPAPPGSGKSTLCAALVGRGWRLLSDEFALIDLASGAATPIPRPVALKDASVALIRAWAPEAFLGPEVDNNEGERVAYMRPPSESVRNTASAVPGSIVIPQFVAGSRTRVDPIPRARALMHLADSSFNYSLHGRPGFERLADIVDRAPCCTIRYSNLEEGFRAVGDWCDGSRPSRE
jgi:HprK-related kinase A